MATQGSFGTLRFLDMKLCFAKSFDSCFTEYGLRACVQVVRQSDLLVVRLG
jgi:hypothetical protein